MRHTLNRIDSYGIFLQRGSTSPQGQAALIPVVLAMFHTCFNVLNTALLIGFIPQLEKIVCRLLTEKHDEAKQPTTLHYISASVMQTPEIAVLQAQKEIVHYAKRIHRYETIADNMEIEIANYLGQVGNQHLSDETKEKTRVILRQIGELESIGDACCKMARTVVHLRENKEDFSTEQYARLHDMLQLVNEAVVQMIVCKINNFF